MEKNSRQIWKKQRVVQNSNTLKKKQNFFGNFFKSKNFSAKNLYLVFFIKPLNFFFNNLIIFHVIHTFHSMFSWDSWENKRNSVGFFIVSVIYLICLTMMKSNFKGKRL